MKTASFHSSLRRNSVALDLRSCISASAISGSLSSCCWSAIAIFEAELKSENGFFLLFDDRCNFWGNFELRDCNGHIANLFPSLFGLGFKKFNRPTVMSGPFIFNISINIIIILNVHIFIF